MKERWLTEFKKDAQKLVTQYSIMLCHAECYLVNFEDEYICHKHDPVKDLSHVCDRCHDFTGCYATAVF